MRILRNDNRMTSANPAEKKKAKEPKLYSTLQLSKLLKVDRLTAAKRLRAAGIDPHPTSTQNNKLYELTEAVKIAVSRSDFAKDEATLKEKSLKNEKLQMELDAKKGELVSVREVTEEVSAIVKALHEKVLVQLPKAKIKQIRAAKTDDEALRLLTEAIGRPFAQVREDYTRFLI